MMSCLFLVILVLVIRSVTLPGASKGLSFYLVPDFQAMKEQGIIEESVSAAMGRRTSH